MSFQIKCDRASISMLLLLSIVTLLLISNTNATTVKFSHELNGDGGSFVPLPRETHEEHVRRMIDKRPDAPNEFDDGQQRSFSIRLRDLQGFIGQLVDDEQMKMEKDAIATVGSMPNRRSMSANLLFNDQILDRVRRFAERYFFQEGAVNALSTSGRVFLFKGEHPITPIPRVPNKMFSSSTQDSRN